MIGDRANLRRRWVAALALAVLHLAPGKPSGQPFMANGVKIGEVTAESAVVWTRLTAVADRNRDGRPFEIGDVVARREMPEATGRDPYWGQVPEGTTLEEMADAVPGAEGVVRLLYREAGGGRWAEVPWARVGKGEDFTHSFELEGLRAGTRYEFRAEGSRRAGGEATARVESAFRTAPGPENPARVVFAVVSCGRWKTRDHPDGQEIYPRILDMAPDFFVHTGDIVYYDHTHPYATHIDLARFRWNRMYALPFLRAFHNRVPSYFMRDDHDTWQNDCWPGQENRMGNFTLAQGQAVFREQTPVTGKTYRTARWGRDLQVWFSEGRDYRSPNPMEDGPEKTIWGEAQWAWFERTVRGSDATFRILISPSPVVGPDHAGKRDNHSNPNFSYEGERLRTFLGEQGMVVICGDRHWQYVSEDPETGVREYGSGATTDEHATMIQNDDLSTVQYVDARGGYLSVTVDRTNGDPRAVFRHHDVAGRVVHEAVEREKSGDR